MKKKPQTPITSIRTGYGDTGLTFLQQPGILKSDPIVEFVGDLDETSASLGLCDVSFDACFEIELPHFVYHKQLYSIFEQTKRMPFILGAMVHSKEARNTHQDVLTDYLEKTSNVISTIINNEDIPIEPLKGFIIPNEENGDLMLARAIVRRAERHAVAADCLWAVPVLNVMSDFLFFLVWFSSHFFEQWCGIDETNSS